MRQLRSVLVADEAITADTVNTYDLPVNPLSHIIFTIKCLNVTDEATLAEILARISKITVSRLGQTQLDISGADLFAMNLVYFGHAPILANRIATDNATRYLTMILPFGRWLFNPSECYPKSSAGEVKLQITVSATETACDGVIFLIETVELIGASPSAWRKVTTLTKTPAATGEMDVDLPIGNDLAGILLFSTTVPATTAWTTTVDWVKLLRDNVEEQISKAYWESMHGDLLNRCGYHGDYSAAFGNDIIHKYALLDFDPLQDGSFLVKTSGSASMKLRVNAGDTNILRVLPYEIVKA